MDVWLDSLQMAWRTLVGNRLRTALTALSVAMGAGAIALMVSLSSSGVATITAGLDAVGGRRLVFVLARRAPGAPRRYDRGLTREDAEALRERVPGLLRLSFLASVPQQVILGAGKKADVDVAAGSIQRSLLFPSLLAGNDVPDDAAHDDARVCVLAHGLATTLFGSPAAALGQDITLWGERYRVAGVTSADKRLGFSFGGAEPSRAVFLSASALAREQSASPVGYVMMEGDDTVTHELQMAVARTVIRARHRDEDDVELLDMRRQMAGFDMVFRGLNAVTGLLAAISLFIAGAGIMNVLLASIRERVAEIGIRRALGATRADVVRQFVTESAGVAAVGGLTGSGGGLLLAWICGRVVAAFFPSWEVRVDVVAAAVAMAVAVLTGVTFGLAPARRAAKLAIVPSLRGGE